MANHGWRSVFYWFAIPGFFMAAIWYLFVHNNPKESPYCNEQEVAYISSAIPAPEVPTSAVPGKRATRDFGWLDWLIRAKKCPTLDTNTKVFCSRNIWTVTLAYFMMIQVFIGLLTWVPSYLVTAKHFPLMTMGFVAATPWIGAVLGAIIGGWISDNVLMGRRKPNMMFAALTVAIIMLVINYLPTTVTAVSIGLFLSGFLLNIGWQNFMVYPMGLTDVRTYPVAISIVNSGGNLGGFFSPMIAGWILDTYKTYDVVFMFFAACSIVSLLLLGMLDEPV